MYIVGLDFEKQCYIFLKEALKQENSVEIYEKKSKILLFQLTKTVFFFFQKQRVVKTRKETIVEDDPRTIEARPKPLTMTSIIQSMEKNYFALCCVRNVNDGRNQKLFLSFRSLNSEKNGIFDQTSEQAITNKYIHIPYAFNQDFSERIHT